jgi:hypothetical protein
LSASRAWTRSLCSPRARVGVGFGRIPRHPRARDRMGGFGGFRGVQAGTDWRFMAVPHHARRWRSLAPVGAHHQAPRALVAGFAAIPSAFWGFLGPVGLAFPCAFMRHQAPCFGTGFRVGARAQLGKSAPTGGQRFGHRGAPWADECPTHRPALLQAAPSIIFRGSTARRGPVAPAQGPRNAATLCVAWRARSPRALCRLDRDRGIVLLGSVPGFIGIRSGVCWDPFVSGRSSVVS